MTIDHHDHGHDHGNDHSGKWWLETQNSRLRRLGPGAVRASSAQAQARTMASAAALAPGSFGLGVPERDRQDVQYRDPRQLISIYLSICLPT